MNRQTRMLLAIVLAGTAGTIINALAASVLVDATKINFLLVPARYVIAIGVAILLPILWGFLRGKKWWLASLVMLVGVPSIIAKLVLGVAAPWAMVFLLNAFYAITTIIAYEIIVGQRKIR